MAKGLPPVQRRFEDQLEHIAETLLRANRERARKNMVKPGRQVTAVHLMRSSGKKARDFKDSLDGRVKPGHDIGAGSRCMTMVQR